MILLLTELSIVENEEKATQFYCLLWDSLWNKQNKIWMVLQNSYRKLAATVKAF